MKTYPKAFDGRQTTKEEWDRYEQEVKDHESHYRAIEPKDKTSREYADWNMAYHMNRPNKPGYEFANND